MTLANCLHISAGGACANRDRIDNHARFKPLNLTDFVGLLLNSEVTVDHTNPAGLRHDNRKARLGDSIHSRRDQRHIDINTTCKPRHKLSLGGHNV